MNKHLIRFLKPKKAILKWLIIPIILTVIGLGFGDYLNEPIKYLNSLTFNLGKLSFSVYGIIKIVVTLILLIWTTTYIAGSASNRIRKLKKMPPNNRALLRQFCVIAIYTVGFFISLDVIGIDLAAFAVIGGAIGIGIGFGLQKIASNFISGIILLFDKSVKHDDLVQLSDGAIGYIREMGARYSLLETFDGKEIIIPNEDLITNPVVNLTHTNKQARIDISIGVSYNSDLDLVKQLLLESVCEHSSITHSPEPTCYLTEFADNSVNFVIYCWVSDVTQGRMFIKSEIMFSIWNKFKHHEIQIPYPQRDVHIISNSRGVTEQFTNNANPQIAK